MATDKELTIMDETTQAVIRPMLAALRRLANTGASFATKERFERWVNDTARQALKDAYGDE